MARKAPLALVVTAVLAGLLSCSSASAQLTSPTTGAASPPDLVEVSYFYEQDCCFCLGLASEWINTTLNTDYKAPQDAGRLVYKTWNTQDPANAEVVRQFKAPLVSFHITTVRGTVRATHEVAGLWLYTDSSGKNEMLKSKFIGLLKSELDRALAGN